MTLIQESTLEQLKADLTCIPSFFVVIVGVQALGIEGYKSNPTAQFKFGNGFWIWQHSSITCHDSHH